MKSTAKDPNAPPDMSVISSATPKTVIKKEVTDRLSGKESKSEVNYRHVPKGSKTTALCGNCMYFATPGSCSRVAGSISSQDVCDLFAEK